MNFSMVRYVLGKVLLCESVLLLLPALVSLIYREDALWALLGSAALCAVLGLAMSVKPHNRVMYQREGFAITALAWIVISIMGALPFLFSGVITNPIDALFETVSGFTTTGASILSDVEILPRGILFWRSFTHWIGGMGVLVFLLTLLPMTGGSHVNLMKAESPGPQVEKLLPKVQSTALVLYLIYFGMTVLQVIFLLAGGMNLFESLLTAFGTAGTGGFGFKNDSMGSFSPYIQTVIAVFMMLFGINFNFYFLLLLHRFKKAFAMEEVRAYLMIIAAAVGLIFINTRSMYQSFGETLRHAFFQVSSIITTTGYTTTDFDLWPMLAQTVLLLLMFIGACAGSTGGGYKVSRLAMQLKTIKGECRSLLHPKSVNIVTMDGKTVPATVLRSLGAYTVAYILIFLISLLLVSFDGYDFTTVFSSVAATFNNIGPALGGAGPMRNYSLFSDFSTFVMTLDMLAGRLEIFPLLVMFDRNTWKRF